MDRNLTIVYEVAEEGGFTASIAEVPGAVSEGDTIDEAKANVLDALKELSAYRRESAQKKKGPTTSIESIPASF